MLAATSSYSRSPVILTEDFSITSRNRYVMSYFLFGEFVFSKSLQPKELNDFAFNTVGLATSPRLGVPVGHAEHFY